MIGVNLGYYGALPDRKEVVNLIQDSDARGVRFLNWLLPYCQRRINWDSTWRWDGGDWFKVPTPLLWCIDVANSAGVSGWYTIPYLLNDEELRGACMTIEARSQHPYTLEIGNEHWNTGGRYTWQNARYRINGRGDAQKAYAADVRRLASYAGKRARIVAGAQAMSIRIADDLLNKHDLGGTIDAIAIAPYYAPPHRVKVDDYDSAGALADACQRDIVGPVAYAIHQHKTLARQHGIGLVAYEAGNHIIGNAPYVHKLVNSQTLGDLDALLLSMWRSADGGDLYWYRLYGPHDASQHFDRVVIDGNNKRYRPNFYRMT